MQVEYQVLGGKGKLGFDANSINEAFQFLAQSEMVFGVDRCGNCESTNLALMYKTPGEYEYYSIKCKDCRHEYTFGQTKDGHKLFPNGFKKHGSDWVPPYESNGEGGNSNRDNVNQDNEPESRQSNSGNERKANRGF